MKYERIITIISTALVFFFIGVGVGSYAQKRRSESKEVESADEVLTSDSDNRDYKTLGEPPVFLNQLGGYEFHFGLFEDDSVRLISKITCTFEYGGNSLILGKDACDKLALDLYDALQQMDLTGNDLGVVDTRDKYASFPSLENISGKQDVTYLTNEQYSEIQKILQPYIDESVGSEVTETSAAFSEVTETEVSAEKHNFHYYSCLGYGYGGLSNHISSDGFLQYGENLESPYDIGYLLGFEVRYNSYTDESYLHFLIKVEPYNNGIYDGIDTWGYSYSLTGDVGYEVVSAIEKIIVSAPDFNEDDYKVVDDLGVFSYDYSNIYML